MPADAHLMFDRPRLKSGVTARRSGRTREVLGFVEMVATALLGADWRERPCGRYPSPSPRRSGPRGPGGHDAERPHNPRSPSHGCDSRPPRQRRAPSSATRRMAEHVSP